MWPGLCGARQWPRAPGCSSLLGLPGAAQAAEPIGSSPLPDSSSPTVRLLATGSRPRLVPGLPALQAVAAWPER